MFSILLLLSAIDVDVGRQLFVDDFLIASSSGVVRHVDCPARSESPVVRPTSPDGTRMGGCAVATDGGLWWDAKRGKFRLWLEDDWCGNLCTSESPDGLVWSLPKRVFEQDSEMDSWTVFPDYSAADPYSAWCLYISAGGAVTKDAMFVSEDGCSFRMLGISGYSHDRSTAYYDPFRGEWVFSLRALRGYGSKTTPVDRLRDRFTVRRFRPPAKPYQTVTGGDSPHPLVEGRQPTEPWRELERPFLPGGALHGKSLYNFTAVAYESLMLGFMEVLSPEPKNAVGHEDNDACADVGLPKRTDLHFAFSRDGVTYNLLSPAPSVSASGWGSGKWDTGYLSPVGGGCVIVDERLRFYYSALRGDALRRCTENWMENGMYYNGSIGYAELRRDGFAGLVADGCGEVVTKPLIFSGGHLFVNAECLFGEVAAEVLSADGTVVPGYSAEDCRELRFADTTRHELIFAGGSLASLGKRGIALRFRLHCATLYSFWISRSERGESCGYVAAGGPAYRGLRDN